MQMWAVGLGGGTVAELGCDKETGDSGQPSGWAVSVFRFS